jgi:hypothetical protein
MQNTIDTSIMNALKANIKTQAELLDFIKNYREEE